MCGVVYGYHKLVLISWDCCVSVAGSGTDYGLSLCSLYFNQTGPFSSEFI